MLGTNVSAAPVPGTVHFTAVGDFASTANSSAVFAKMKAIDADLTLALGDLSYGLTGQEQAWCDYVTSRLRPGYPFELVSGNHESNGINGNINDFSACLPNQLPGAIGTYGKQYYVDVPATNPLVRFVMISPSLGFPDGNYNYPAGSARYQWTSDTIDGARTAGIPWVVVGMHKPCITVGQYVCDPGADLFNLLLSKRVDLVLSGHEHTYQRSNQLALGPGCTALVPGTFDPACVADSDSAFTKGAGTVDMVVGTGGNSLYDITAGDTEAGYFGAVSGANQNPTWGLLDVSATADTLTASFAQASGGTFADSFTISRNTTPNTPPVASFTSSCTNLGCAFNTSGSSDPDGTIAAYAWTFGDGTTGTGAAPSHTYTAAGAYSVGLTLTDNAGARTSTTNSVTVTAPATTTFASDQFSRTVTNAFGTAPIGGPWTLSGGATLFGVANGVGSIKVAAGSGPVANLASASAGDTDLKMSFGLDKNPIAGTVYLSVYGRRSTAGAYLAKPRVSASGAVSLELDRKPATGADVVLQPVVVVSGLTYAPGDMLNVRLQVVGSAPATIRAKVWKVGTAEPAVWQRSITDSTAGLQASGSIGVSPYLSAGATNAPVTVKIDDLTLSSP
jgi:PKD repeat protein